MVSVKKRREKALPAAEQNRLLELFWDRQQNHILTKPNIMSWIEGSKHTKAKKALPFREMDSDDIAPYIIDIKIPVMSVEVAPKTKKIHGHVLLEIKHRAYIELNVASIQETMTKELPPELLPKTGNPYVWVKIVSAGMYTLTAYINKGQEPDKQDVEFSNIVKKLAKNPGGEKEH